MLGLLEKIRRHASIARGDFERMFAGIEIPPLPAAVSRLVLETGKADPDMKRLGLLSTAVPEISARILKTVNSALFMLPTTVSSVTHAVTLLGLQRIRPLILSYAAIHSLPEPEGDLFQRQTFWADALLKALIARALSERRIPAEREQAFTAMLLADVALPVLLTAWGDYYGPVVAQWRHAGRRLSALEREHFQWDHAQAGAWILENWGFPDDLVCFVGLHNAEMAEIREFGLEHTIALPVAVAALAPSTLDPDPTRTRQMLTVAADRFELALADLEAMVAVVGEGYGELCLLFDIDSGHVSAACELLAKGLQEIAAQNEPAGEQ